MGSFSIWHWLIVLVIILLVFGAGKLPKVAGDLASGIKNFRKGMQEGEKDEPKPGDQAKVIDGSATTASSGMAANKDKAAQG